jgi:hypothetical protein
MNGFKYIAIAFILFTSSCQYIQNFGKESQGYHPTGELRY